MTSDERDWHEQMAHRLRGDVVNLAVAAQAFDRYGEVLLAKGARVLIRDLQQRAHAHEESAAEGGDAAPPMA
jgi:hypothetical protein